MKIAIIAVVAVLVIASAVMVLNRRPAANPDCAKAVIAHNCG